MRVRDFQDSHPYNLQVRGLFSAIGLEKTRIDKKEANNQVRLGLRQTPQSQQGLQERRKGELKVG